MAVEFLESPKGVEFLEDAPTTAGGVEFLDEVALEAPDRPAPVRAAAEGGEVIPPDRDIWSTGVDLVRDTPVVPYGELPQVTPQDAPAVVEASEVADEETMQAHEFQSFQKQLNPLEPPVGNVGTAALGTLTRGAADAAAGALDFLEPDQVISETAGNPANQHRLDAVRQRLTDTAAQRDTPQYQELLNEARELSRPMRENTFAGKLSRTAANAAADAERVPGAAGSIARGVGGFASFLPALALGPGGATAFAAAGAESGARTATADDLRAGGVTDETEIYNAAKEAGNEAAAKAAIQMPLYYLSGRLAAASAGKLLPNATRFKTVAAQTIAATGANVVSGAMIRTLEGGEAMPNLEQFTMDMLWGAAHGVGVNVSEKAKSRARVEMESRGLTPQQIDSPSGVADLVPAIRVGEQVVKGNTGETHQDVIKRFAVENPEQAGDAWANFGSKENPNFFVGPDEVPISREQLQERFGVSDSQGLRDLQTAPPVASRPDIQKAVDSPMFKIELPKIEATPEVAADPSLQPLRRIDRSKAAAIGGSAGQPRVRPIGGPPSGSPTWLKIEPFYKRKGFEREGASAILQGRQQNPIGKALGKATDKQFDVEAELQGRMWKTVDVATRGLGTKEQEAAFNELARYTREKENGRPAPALSSTAQKLLDGWKDIAEFTGLLAQRSGVQVLGTGGYRPIKLIGREYVPRMFDPAFLRAVRDPNKYAAEFNTYATELSTKWGVPPAEAAKELNDMAGGRGRLATNDFMGNIEMARGEKLPESFYDYDMRRVMARYIDGYSRRMGQIIAYGQRLEGPRGPAQKNLWDMARDEVQGGDKITSQWIEEAEAQSVGERKLGAPERIMARLQTVATGMLLGNPTSTVPRNLFSGLETAVELMGTRRTLKAAAQTILKPAARLEPREAGVIKDDMAALLHAEQLTGDNALDNSLRWLTNNVLKYSGYNTSENFVRTTNFLAGSAFAKDFAALAAKSPNNRTARQMAGLIERMGVKPDDVIAESGDWRRGEATRTFIRKVVNSSQGGYRFNQVPLWAGTPMGRFFYQFGRWGTQRAQNLWNNVLSPALVGNESTINGTKMTVRDFKPLVRMGLGTVAMGEGFALLAQTLFGKDRRDASLTEISTAWDEDKKKAIKLAASRIINDIIMSGSLGIWGQPVDWGMAAKDQSRLKNPAEPPGGTFIRSSIGLVQNLIDQGTLTPDDIKRFAQSFVPGVPAVTDVVRNAMDQPKYEAENDQRTLRMAGIRFAQDTGMDVEQGSGKDEPRKNERTPVFTAIRDALIVGDVATAKELEAKYIASLPDNKRETARKSLRASIVGRQPFRVGPYTSEEVKKDFYQWAKKNLSTQDLGQVKRVQARYENAARAAGMWKN